MKFDTVIIGAGLAGVTAAIRLAEEGRRVGLVSAGRSSMHFHSGSLGLLDYDAGHSPTDDIEAAINGLPEPHPYRKIGAEAVVSRASEAAAILRRSGVKVSGSIRSNHKRISPLGVLRPAWLTLENVVTLDALKSLSRPHVAIISLAGFLDFYPRFIASSLGREGFKCEILSVDTPELRSLRASEAEMRSANIARVMSGEALDRFTDAVHVAVRSSDAAGLIIPAVINFDGDGEALRLRTAVGRPLFYAPTMGVSVPGITMHTRLLRHFISLGGCLLNGHRVSGADFAGDRLMAVYTDKLDDDELRADSFIFAAGSFFGRGIKALPDSVVEPVVGLDTVAPADRGSWFDADLFGVQPIMTAGIATDSGFHALRSGSHIANLFVAGSALAGANSVREDSGAGVAMITALHVAEKIINNN